VLVEGDHATTPEAAILSYQKAEDLLARDLPVIPLRYAKNSFGYSTRVTNVDIDAFAHVKLLELTPAPH